MEEVNKKWMIEQLETISRHIHLTDGDVGKVAAYEIKRTADELIDTLKKENLHLTD